MKLKLYKPGKIRKEGTIQFQLREGCNGEIELVVYDNEGGTYDYAQHVLDITPDGIKLIANLSEYCELPKSTKTGKVKVV